MNQISPQGSIPFEITQDDLALLDTVAPMLEKQKFPLPSLGMCLCCRT